MWCVFVSQGLRVCVLERSACLVPLTWNSIQKTTQLLIIKLILLHRHSDFLSSRHARFLSLFFLIYFAHQGKVKSRNFLLLLFFPPKGRVLIQAKELIMRWTHNVYKPLCNNKLKYCLTKDIMPHYSFINYLLICIA